VLSQSVIFREKLTLFALLRAAGVSSRVFHEKSRAVLY